MLWDGSLGQREGYLVGWSSCDESLVCPLFVSSATTEYRALQDAVVKALSEEGFRRNSKNSLGQLRVLGRVQKDPPGVQGGSRGEIPRDGGLWLIIIPSKAHSGWGWMYPAHSDVNAFVGSSESSYYRIRMVTYKTQRVLSILQCNGDGRKNLEEKAPSQTDDSISQTSWSSMLQWKSEQHLLEYYITLHMAAGEKVAHRWLTRKKRDESESKKEMQRIVRESIAREEGEQDLVQHLLAQLGQSSQPLWRRFFLLSCLLLALTFPHFLSAVTRKAIVADYLWDGRSLYGEKRPYNYWNSWLRTILDLLGGLLLLYLLLSIEELTPRSHPQGKPHVRVSAQGTISLLHQTVQSLEDASLHAALWLCDWPGGFKLNSGLSNFFAELFSRAVWLRGAVFSALMPSVSSSSIFTLFVIFCGMFGGASTLLAFSADSLILATLPLQLYYCCLLVVLQGLLLFLRSLFLLFRGKIENQFRLRVDVHAYDTYQMLAGTLLFAIALFLFPTVLSFFSFAFFTCLFVRLVATSVLAMSSIFTYVPVCELVLALFSSPSLSSSAFLHPSSSSLSTVSHMRILSTNTPSQSDSPSPTRYAFTTCSSYYDLVENRSSGITVLLECISEVRFSLWRNRLLPPL